jgi:hypothetical protein
MGSQILFFMKNKCDLGNPAAVATASEGQSFASYVQNRSNRNAWITTGSVDANNTTFTMDLGDTRTIAEILLVKHNFKAFTIKYWNGSAYVNFATPIAETVNTKATSWYTVTPVQTQKIQIVITGTMVANSDKFLYQLILTERIGKLQGWPVIERPSLSKNRKANVMLSGKTSLAQNVGGFSCELRVDQWNIDADLTVVERLFDYQEGFLVWLCGGDDTQFAHKRQGYRLEDVFTMRCVNDYSPAWVNGQYRTGLQISMKLAEVTD